MIVSATEKKNYTLNDIEERIDSSINWQKQSLKSSSNQNVFGNDSIKDFYGSGDLDWYAVDIGRCGQTDNFNEYIENISDYVVKKYKTPNLLDQNKATEWHRISLGILSCGGDPTKINGENGETINLIADGTYNRSKTKDLGFQGINGYIWGLIALDSMRYKVPQSASQNRDSIITNILEQQLSNGGFCLPKANDPNAKADVDMTGMALTSLAPYYNSEKVYNYKSINSGKQVSKTVRECVDKALDWLSTVQSDDGDFKSWGSYNVESTAQTLTALSALNIDARKDVRFIKNGNTLIDGIMKYYIEDDGAFAHSFSTDKSNPSAQAGKANAIGTQQAVYALTAYCRSIGKMRSLFDFRKEMDNDLKNKIIDLDKKIVELDSKDINSIEEIFKEYLEIPVEERCYVGNYNKLSDLMKKNNIKNSSESLSDNMDITESGNGYNTYIFGKENLAPADYTFSDEDKSSLEIIKSESPSKKQYQLVENLINKLYHSINKNDFTDDLSFLEDRLDKIGSIDNQINVINQKIESDLLPVDKLTKKDKGKIESILTKCSSLSEYDLASVKDYSKLKDKYNSIISSERTTTIVIVCSVSIVIILLAIFLVLKNKKRKIGEKNG